MSKDSVGQIVSQIGATRLAAELGVSHHSIRAAKTAGSFPASWYMTIRRLCEEADAACPVAAFNWRRAESAAPTQDASP
jgi:hypothetical protein